ncbi:hypothetical protein OHV08_00965 [Streptomyces canus]|uniref:hypothetical protein n=1 Tax=Streptomyces canus TaxID=58343 RepID=UPI00324F391B
MEVADLATWSTTLVEGTGQIPVGCPCSVGFGLAFVQKPGQIDGVLFEGRDERLQFSDIGRRRYA